MFSITKTSGKKLSVYELIFSEFIDDDEMKRWVEESRQTLRDAPPKFCVKIDMSKLRPLPLEAQATMLEGQKLYRQKGMVRSAVIVNSVIMKMHFERIAKKSGIHEWERYFSSDETDFDAKADEWLAGG